MVNWVTPKTFYAGNIPTHEEMNIYVRDNLGFLKERPFNSGSTGVVNSTNTSFVEVTNSSMSLTTFGGNLLYWACGTNANNTGGAFNTFDLAVDGIRQAHATFGNSIITTPTANYNDNLNMFLITTNRIDAGTHACSLMWKVSAGTGTVLLRVYVMEIR